VRKFLLFFAILVFLVPTFASINLVSYEFVTPQPILEGMEKVDFNIIVQNVGDAKTIDFNAYVNGTLIHSEQIAFDANETKELSFSWENSELAIQKGHYVVDVNVQNKADPTDYNSLSFDFNVFKGKNLTILSLTSDRINYEPGSVAYVTGIIINNGDLVASEDFNACYYLNGTFEKCVRILSLDIDQYYVFDVNVQLPSQPQTNTLLLVVDTENEVAEFDETDNNKAIQLSTVSEIDLSIIADDITFDKAIAKEKMTITAKIKNLGRAEAENVDVKIFIGESEETGTLIYYNTFAQIPGNSSKTITAYWTPPAEGYNVINVLIDPENKLNERNRQNNNAKRGFYVSPPPEGEEKAYTFILETQETCMALLSNNDRIIMDGIVDLNGTPAVKLKVYDADGTERINDTFKEDEEIVLPGRTIRVLNAESFFARLLLVYQQPVTMLYNSCQMDIKHEYERSQTYKRERDKCIQEKSVLESKLNACLKEKESMLNSQTNYKKMYEECLLAKEEITNKLTNARDECQQKIQEEIIEAQKRKEDELKPLIAQKEAQLHEKAIIIDQLEKEVDNLRRTVTLAQYGFAAVLFTIAGILFYTHLKREGKI